MTQVRVRDKHQITLPAAVARAANIGKDDILDVRYENGVITLTSQHTMQQRKPSLMALAGSTKGLYGAITAKRKQYTANERNAWDR